MQYRYPVNVFPQLAARAAPHRWANGTVPFEPNAPLCDPAPGPDTSWRLDRIDVSSRFVSHVTLRVPLYLQSPDAPLHDPQAEDEGGILLALWRADQRISGSHGRVPHVAIWVGPEPGYPTVAADPTTVQTAAHECQFLSANGQIYVVRFTLHSAQGLDAHIAAVLPIGSGRFVTFDASSSDAEFPTRDGWAMIRSLEVTLRGS
jgi:hypothetical protein